MKNAKSSDYKIEFNGSSTWMLVDLHGDCLGCYETEKKAKNALNRTLNLAGK